MDDAVVYSHEQNRLFAACIYSSVMEALRAESTESAAENETAAKKPHNEKENNYETDWLSRG